MDIFNRLVTLWGLKRTPRSKIFELDENLRSALVDIALYEQRPAREIQADLLAVGLFQRRTHTELWHHWHSLTLREQDVAALTCLGYTNRQIAARLELAPNTVKGYVRQVLVKFSLHSKAELHMLLAGWDFSQWGQKYQ
jgi:DNA-binding CsgD family transcriptional regulator